MSPGPGSEVGVAGHCLESPLYEGGMARIFRVMAPDGSARLLKMPRREFGSHPACLAGFETERIILRRLQGTLAPRLFETGELEDGTPWMICEDLGRDSLAASLGGGRPSIGETVRIGKALASLLAALHRQGIVHHDIKPSHVLFREDGMPVLIDFGLANCAKLPDFVADEAADRRLVLGTPAYIAPEQWAGRRGDPRSDLYSFGALLYQMVTGTLPFGEPRSRLTIGLRRFLDCRPPIELEPACPPWLQEVVLHCLEPDLARRYGSAAQIATDLRHPEQVHCGERATRRRRRFGVVLKRLLAATGGSSVLPPAAPEQPDAAPQILVALDVADAQGPLAEALRLAVVRLVGVTPQARVICIHATAGITEVAMEEADGLADSLRSEALMALRQWAAPMQLAADRLRFVVVETDDAASAVIDYAQTHQIEQIVIGARGSSTLRRLIGSVSARVAAEAPCSVSVIRRA